MSTTLGLYSLRYRNTLLSAACAAANNICKNKTTNKAMATAAVAAASVGLPGGLKPELMPEHVGVIMDGHRRWAKENGYTVEEGHRAGGKALKNLAYLCATYGVKTLTTFAFSTENWVRPREEVDLLMSCFEEGFQTDLVELISNGFKASFIGNKSRLPKTLQDIMSDAEESSKNNHGVHLILALNYSGRHDILHATRSLCNQVNQGLLQPQDIDERVFERHLQTNTNNNLDLLIRTSGEQRISNFMLWQLAYTELWRIRFCTGADHFPETAQALWWPQILISLPMTLMCLLK